MGPGTRFQRLIPEVLHPNPLGAVSLDKPDNIAAQNLWARNNAEPRIPYMLAQDASCPLTLPTGTQEPSNKPSLTESGDVFTLEPPHGIKKLIFCSGQVYYLLHRARILNNLRDVAIVRVEQVTPFPFWEAKAVIDFYKESLEEIVWAQEESLNSGSWQFVEPRLETVIRSTEWWTNEHVSKCRISYPGLKHTLGKG